MTDDLRIHAAREPGPGSGDFVLDWMQGIAMRARQNPALNFAIEQANLLGRPVLVYQGLRDDYPWASDRPFYRRLIALAWHLGESRKSDSQGGAENTENCTCCGVMFRDRDAWPRDHHKVFLRVLRASL